MNSELENQVAIFKNATGEIQVDVRLQDETVWLTQAQIASLFARERSVITKHINNILKEEELDKSVCANFALTAADGKIYQIEHYNLDMIISVGYRVNSKRGVEFRRWANKVLKEYLVQGYSINQNKLAKKEVQELKQLVELLSTTLINQNLVNETGAEVLSLIKSYATTWDLLLKYDEDRLDISKTKQTSVVIRYQNMAEIIKVLKQELLNKKEASELFGRERDNSLSGIIGNLYQTFNEEDLYPTIAQKAAHLLYFIIKDHPFSDGNKRIGCLLFLHFMQRNKCSLTAITPEGLTALALLIAQSNPSDKELIIKLVVNLIEKQTEI